MVCISFCNVLAAICTKGNVFFNTDQGAFVDICLTWPILSALELQSGGLERIRTDNGYSILSGTVVPASLIHKAIEIGAP